MILGKSAGRGHDGDYEEEAHFREVIRKIRWEGGNIVGNRIRGGLIRGRVGVFIEALRFFGVSVVATGVGEGHPG